MSKKNKSGFEGFLDIVAKILIVMALLMGISLMASLSSNRVELPTQPTTPVDDGMITFQLFGTLEHAYQCDGCSDNGYVTYTCAEGTTWEEFIGKGSTPISRGETEIYVTYTMDGGGHSCYTLPDVEITDVIIAGAKYGSPDLIS